MSGLKWNPYVEGAQINTFPCQSLDSPTANYSKTGWKLLYCQSPVDEFPWEGGLRKEKGEWKMHMFILALIFKPTYRSFNAAFHFDGLTFDFCRLEAAEQFSVLVAALLEKLSPSWESHCQNNGVCSVLPWLEISLLYVCVCWLLIM